MRFLRAGRQQPAAVLSGRDEELRILRSFLHDARARGASLLLTGEPGVGKSALAEVAARTAAANGTTVLRTAGTEFRAPVGYSGLDHLLEPVRPDLRRLTSDARNALMSALGLRDGPTPDRLMVSNATLALLRRRAADRPVLVIVDDAQWLDLASALVLAFTARRLTGTRVGLLAASRPGPDGVFEKSGLPELPVGPLDPAAAADLIGRAVPALHPRVRQRLLTEAQGNPLALTELPAALSDDQRSGRRPLPPVLQVGDRLGALFTARIAALPAPTRELLLLAALQGSGDLRVVQAAAAADVRAALAAADGARLVTIDHDAGVLLFRHPAVRSTVVGLATDVERRRAHRALAATLAEQPERRAWHLAEATTGADEHVAALLEENAGASLRRGDAVGAVAALARAADLSPHGTDRARRLVGAATIRAEVTGDLDDASVLLGEARAAQPDLGGSLHAAVAAAYLLLNAETDVDAAHRLLVAAVERHPRRHDAGDAVLIDALFALLMICWTGGRPELWAPFHEAVGRLGPRIPAVLDLCRRTFGDPVRLARPALPAAAEAAGALLDENDPVLITRVAVGCVYLDRVSDCRPALRRVIRDGRDGGAVALAINALVSSCVDDWLRGEWDEAQRLAGEGIRMSEAHGYRRYTFVLGGYITALVAAARGDAAGSRRAADDMTRWAAPRGARIAVQFAHHVRALSAAGAGDHESAYRAASAVSPAGVLAPYTPHALWVMLDLVDAAVHTGRLAEAANHVRAMRTADVATISPRLALVSAGCAAMAAPADDDAAAWYRRALAVPGAERWPFDLARVQLAYGERRRRAGAVDARNHLGSALEIFERLGARPWADRAAGQLRAGGVPTGRGPGARTLTPQERQVAELAASGMTNKEIGARLRLSHRTVGMYLYQVFPKLGVTTRAALRDALAADAGED